MLALFVRQQHSLVVLQQHLHSTAVTTSGGATSRSLSFTSIASASGQERLVGLVSIASGNPASVTYSNVQIDGQTATQVGSYVTVLDANGNGPTVSFWRAAGTSSTSINVTYTIATGAVFDARGALWTLNNAGTLYDSQAATATNIGNIDLSLDVDTVTGGAVAAVSLAHSSSSRTATWSGLTERYDGTSDNLYGNDWFSAADRDVSSGSTPLTITADLPSDFVGQPGAAGLAVSFNPGAAAGGATGALTADATVIVGGALAQGSATLVAAGALAATAFQLSPAAAALAPAGALASTAFKRSAAATTLAPSGGLATATIQRLLAASALAPTGAISADTGIVGPTGTVWSGSATLAPAGALAATAFEFSSATATLAAAAALSATAFSGRIFTAERLAPTGGLAATAFELSPASALLASAGGLAASARQSLSAGAGLAGTGGLVAGYLSAKILTAETLAAAGGLATSARLQSQIAATLAATGNIAALANLRMQLAVSFAAAGEFFADTYLQGMQFGSAGLAASGALSANAFKRSTATTLLAPSGALAATAFRVFSGHSITSCSRGSCGCLNLHSATHRVAGSN